MGDEMWQHARAFPETNIHMLENEILCDVTFKTGKDGDAVKCHKFLLASRSPVFYAMFCGGLSEAGNEIIIPDIETEVWRLFLNALYSGHCDVKADTAMALLYTAKKYDVPYLKEQCNKYLEDNLTIDSVCAVLDSSILFDEKVLQNQCLQLISKHTSTVLHSPEFVCVSRDTLKAILELNIIKCREEDVYKACKSWAANVCTQRGEDPAIDGNIRDALGDLLYLIRFPVMQLTTFAERVSKGCVLTPEEKTSIMQDIILNESNSKFCNKKRNQQQLLKAINICRFNVIKHTPLNWTHTGKLDAVNFTVSKDAILTGVALFLPHTSGNINGSVEIFEDNKSVTREKVKIAYEHGKRFEIIPMSKEVNVRKNSTYSIHQSCVGSNTYYGEGQLVCPTQDGIVVSFTNGLSSNNGTDVNRGQIYGVELEVPAIVEEPEA